MHRCRIAPRRPHRYHRLGVGPGPRRHHAGMIERVGRRLVSALDRGRPEPDIPPLGDAGPPAGRSVEFLAYGEDCVLLGRLRMTGDRLTDQLNAQDEYEVLDLVAERLTDGFASEVPALLIARNELLLVQATGPRGDANRRLRTRAYPIAAQLGPYRVHGQLHARPGVDPEVVIHRRAPMVPLTDAWIERPVGDDRELQRIGTVVLNRDNMDWVMSTWDDSSTWRTELPPYPDEGLDPV